MSTRYGYRNGILTFFESATHERTLPIAPLIFNEEFLGTMNGDKWTVITNGGAETQVKVANQHGGVFSLNLTAAIAKQFSGLAANDVLEFSLDEGIIFEARVAVQTVPLLLAEAYFGMANANVEGPLSTDGPTIHACFLIDGAAACAIDCDDNDTDTAITTTGITLLAGAYHIFRIDFTTITDVLFYIDGVRVASGTTFDMSFGTGIVVQPYFMVHKESDAGGIGGGSIYIDYCRVWAATR